MSSKVITLDDNSTYRGLAMSRKNPENVKIAECLHLILSQIAGQRKSSFNKVSCENFGKVLAWFGPGVDPDPKAQFHNFLQRMAHICRQPWFFGLIANPERILHNGDKPVFMIRLSTDPGYFTIQTTTMKTRIIYVHGSGYKPENEKAIFPDLVEFTNNIKSLKAYEPQEGSDFTYIFGKLDERSGAYKSMDSLQIPQ